jgi:hypothetical protein
MEQDIIRRLVYFYNIRGRLQLSEDSANYVGSYPKNRHSYHHLDYPGTCTHSHTKYLKHAYNSDSNHSFRELYETGTVSPRKYKFALENEILFFFTFDFKIKLYIQEF